MVAVVGATLTATTGGGETVTCADPLLPPTVAVMGHYGLVERDGVTRKAGFATLQRLISAGLPRVQVPQGG